MSILLIRTVILYFLTLAAVKIMGKRQLGELQPFELVVILIISDMASLGIQSNTTPLINSIIPIVAICLLQISLSLLNLKSEKARYFVCGKPSVIIKNGVIDQSEIRLQRINLNDLTEQCRAQGYFDLSTIETAILETNGKLSIAPKTASRPLQVKDINEQLPEELLSELVILDGHINNKALDNYGYGERWLDEQLEKNGINKPEEVFIAGISEDGEFFYQRKQKDKRS